MGLMFCGPHFQWSGGHRELNLLQNCEGSWAVVLRLCICICIILEISSLLSKNYPGEVKVLERFCKIVLLTKCNLTLCFGKE